MLIDGRNYPVAAVRETPEVIGGAPTRAEGGGLRSDARAVKQAFQVTTAFLLVSETDALRDSVALDRVVPVDLSYETGPRAIFAAMVRVDGGDTITAATADGRNILRTLALTIREA